jgi:hypothetical protein
VAEQVPPAAEERGKDHEPELVDETLVDQGVDQRRAAVDDHVAF